MRQPFSSDTSLTPSQKRAEARLAEPPRSSMDERPAARYKVHPAQRIFVRGPWEMAASILIGLGVLMLMQPFFLWAYSYSFIVTLVGMVMFLIVSHFPE